MTPTLAVKNGGRYRYYVSASLITGTRSDHTKGWLKVSLSSPILQTGSVLNGNVQGGTGTDNLVLQGSGTESIAKFLSFETLTMQGSDWSITGTGTFSSGTTVQSGILSVNGTLTSPTVTVQNGGILGGAGNIVGNVTNNGIVAPGNSICALTITGNYTQPAGSTLRAEINNTPATDLLNITGTATIQSGATVNVLPAAGLYTVGHRYTILTAADGRSGTYDHLVYNAPFLGLSLDYDANNVFLDVTRSSVAFQQIGQTAFDHPGHISTMANEWASLLKCVELRRYNATTVIAVVLPPEPGWRIHAATGIFRSCARLTSSCCNCAFRSSAPIIVIYERCVACRLSVSLATASPDRESRTKTELRCGFGS